MQPDTTLPYQTVQAHGLQLLADLEAEGDELPAFVRDEFDAHLRCGRSVPFCFVEIVGADGSSA